MRVWAPGLLRRLISRTASPTCTCERSCRGPPSIDSRSVSSPDEAPKPRIWTPSPNICPNIRCRFSCISPMLTAPNGVSCAFCRRATASLSLTSVTSAFAFTSSTVPSVSPVSGSQTSSPSGAKISKSIPCRTPAPLPRLITISLLPRIFATLPSTAMRLAPSDHLDTLARLYLSWRGPPQGGRIAAMPERTNRIGRHLPTSGGLARTLLAARELGCETIQIFVSNPQAWADPVRRRDADTFVEGSLKMGILPVVAHAKYLINLASTSVKQRELSVMALAHELAAAGALGVDLVVVHAGSHGGDGEEKGMERLVEGLERARERAAGLEGAREAVAEPVVENSVGAGTQLCSTFEELGELTRRAGVRVCIDTAHAFVAGYDLSAESGGRGSRRSSW